MNSLVLNQLFRKYQQEMGGFLQQEEGVQQNYTRATQQLGRGRLRDLGKLREQFASRGLTNSGLNLEANVNLETEYGEREADLETRRNQDLAAIARNRLRSESEYNVNRAMHEQQLIQQQNMPGSV